MKFNINTYGKGILQKVMKTIKPKINNIRIENGSFYNWNNEPTKLHLPVYYSHNTANDNYGRPSKPDFLFTPNDATDKFIAVSADRKSFTATRDCVINVTIQEGLLVKKGKLVSITMTPTTGTSQDDYNNTFLIKPNSGTATDNLFKRYAYMSDSSWISVQFVWENIRLKAGKGVKFVIDGIEEGEQGLDGGSFGRISITGVTV